MPSFLKKSKLFHRSEHGTQESIPRIFIYVTIGCLAIALYQAASRAATPFQLDYEEGNILNAAVRLIHGQTPYPAAGTFPYVLNPYGPVGYAVTGLGVRWFGPEFIAPRMFVLFSGIAILFLLTLLTRKFSGHWQIGALLGTLYLCNPLMWFWFPVLRVDFWAILFSLLGLYVLAAFPRAWLLSAIIFALAILTKHTAVAAPAAVVAHLIAANRVRQAMAFAALTFGCVVAVIFTLGGDPLFHLLRTHPEPYSPVHFIDMFTTQMQACILAIGIIIYAAVFGIRWNQDSRLAWLYFAFCSLTMLTAGKLGSNSNHLLEWTAAVYLVAAISLANLSQAANLLVKPFTIGVVLLISIFTLMSTRVADAMKRVNAECPDLYAFLGSSQEDRILSEDVGALLVNQKPVLISNPFVMTGLQHSVNWSQGALEELVERQYFQLILLRDDVNEYLPETRWSARLIKAVREKYKLVGRFQCASVGFVFARR